MTGATKILIVEHDVNDLELLQRELKKSGIDYLSEVVQTETAYELALQNFVPDIILSDYSLPSFDGPTAFKMREEKAPETPFIFVSGTIGEENSIEFIRNGVTDYALKDKLFTLVTKIKRALRESGEQKQKKTTEQELRLSESRLTRAQQVAKMGSWELDLEANVLILSVEAARIFGFPADHTRLPFKMLSSLVHPEDLDQVLQTIKESLESLKDTAYNYRIIHNDGTIKHIYSESKFEFGPNGKSTGLHGIVCDVTETKLAETERTKMVTDLVHRNKDLEQFAYIVSHNLRAPVANIIGATNVLNDPALSTEKRDLLRKGVNESVSKLDGVIKDLNQILQVKRAINETKESVLFSKLVEDIKNSIRDMVEDVRITYDFSEINEFLSLRSYLYSIFYNLILNSIKYRRHDINGIIEIKSHLTTNKVALTFRDNGMGIDLEKRGGQIFGLYKRFHTDIAGKGMGLFMVKTQVETLGGKITVNSQVNKGTEFTIEFDI